MDEKMTKLADALDWDVDGLTPDTPLDTLQWDSMAMLTVIAVARGNGKTVSGSQVRDMQTVGDVLAAI